MAHSTTQLDPVSDQDGARGVVGVQDPRIKFLADITATELEGSGEGIFMVERTVRAVGRAYGLEVAAVVLPAQVVLTASDETGQATIVVREMPGISRLDQVDGLHKLVAAIVDGLPLAEARRRLDGLRSAPRPYPPWLRVVGVSLFAAGFAPSVVGDWTMVGVSVVLGLLMGLILVTFEDRRQEPLLPFLGALIVTAVALTVFPGASEEIGPVALVVPALFVVIPGDYLSAAFGELALGRIVPGSTRLIWALFLLMQLALGVIVAAELTGKGIDALADGNPASTIPFWIVAAAWIPFTVGLTLTFNAPLSALPWMAPLVLGTFLVQRGADEFTGLLGSTIIAGVALGLCATVLSRSPGRPARLLLFLGGFFVLTVGALGLRGITAIAAGDAAAGLAELLNLILLVPAVGLSLTAGYLIAPRRVPPWLSGRRERPDAGGGGLGGRRPPAAGEGDQAH
jgi:uncharacterized membrane protein YjjP (DUF1212 family)